MHSKVSILVVDDEETMRDSCRQALAVQGYRVEAASDGKEGLALLGRRAFDLVILDLKMPGLNGMDVLKRIRETDRDIVVVVITGYATVESAVEAMRHGAYDYIPKPFTPEQLRVIVDRALERRMLSLENVLLRTELARDDYGRDVIIGQSASMQKIEDLIRQVAPTDSTVLITGETGTGKELVARTIHKLSGRKDNPLIVVDCGSLVENLFESELFGHVKGSFTGATQTKYGRFEVANGGTIFLDEVSNISMNIQAKLLRVIQEKEITRVGSTQLIGVDIRIIAASNRDLSELVQGERFRRDLYYRLSVVPIVVPPLRERREDIPLLVNHFLAKYNKSRGRNITAVSDAAMRSLIGYHWPGNVRELENVMERAIVLAVSLTIEAEDLWYHQPGQQPEVQVVADATRIKTLAELEREHIEETLRTMDGQIGRAAEALGIDRKTLRLKLRGYEHP